VAEYSGSRRAAPALTDAETQRAFAEDDAALSCPECGSLVRPDQQWCTLCLHVLHAPAPEPEPEPEPVLPPATPVVATTPAPAEAAQPAASASALPPEVEAAAQALLEQLAYETRQQGLKLPSYLQSKGQKAVAVAVAMTVLSGGVLLLMTILGAAIH
jgi:hypothetical protein